MPANKATARTSGTFVVTGATSGIGHATALALAARGSRVVGIGRDPARSASLAARLGPCGEVLTVDVTRAIEMHRAMGEIASRHGALDGLVVAAGVSHAPSLGDLDTEAFDALMDVNVKGAVFTLVHALPHLAHGASVVFVGSVASRKGQPGDALYAGSKGFVRAFARNLGTSPDLLARGIRVNVVAPGPIETPMTHAATSEPASRAYVEELVPMGRWGRAEEVAEAIVFLLSPASRFTTGAELTVDGGMAHA